MTGHVSFANLAKSGCHGRTMADGQYVFTLQADYGRFCRAASERFEVRDGRITHIFEGSLSSDWPSVHRRARQAYASLQSVKRCKDEESDVLDERWYFPVTSVDMTLPERYQEVIPYLKRIYAVVDKASFLDWGLTSDYTMGPPEEDGECTRAKRARQPASAKERINANAVLASTQYSALPSFAQHASRNVDKLGGGATGSEGYGEATTGSCHKIGTLLTHLRQLVLHDLYDTHWGLMWDLGPHSTFLDIGSGYGKIVFHLRLLARMRRAVGLECVPSRDQIAKQALFQLEAEFGTKWQDAATSNLVRAAASTSADPALSAVAAPAAAASSASASSATSGAPSMAPPALTPAPAMVVAEAPRSSSSSSNGDSNSTAEGSSTDHEEMPHTVPSGPFDGVEFACADATASPALSYTHIYIFDWVFSQATLKDLAQVLQASPFYILCSFRKIQEWWGHGLVKIQPVAKLQGFRTTGGEGMTCFVYINLEKVPAQ